MKSKRDLSLNGTFLDAAALWMESILELNGLLIQPLCFTTIRERIVLCCLPWSMWTIVSHIDVGQDGRANDSTVFKNSTLKIALEQNLLNLPNEGLCVADDAFCLTPYCLKPFSHRGLNVAERVFNYRLSRARRVAENAFGILSSRFRVFNTPIPLNVDTTETLVKSACAIHNWLRQTSSRTYIPSGSVDEEDFNTAMITPGAWRNVPTLMAPLGRLYSSNNCGRTGEKVRQWYMHQFMTSFSVPWQMRSIGVEPDDNKWGE